jgi:thiol:disulfide interchange protein DsbC
VAGRLPLKFSPFQMRKIRMFKPVSVIVAAVLLLASSLATANEAALRKAFQKKFPHMTIESIARTPFPGLYEVVFDGQIIYTDEKMSFLISGNLFDLRGASERNLTRERRDQIAARDLKKFQANAIKRVKGDGRRVVYTFEDPNCGYCRKLQEELNRMTDITIYTFLLPILSPDSSEKSKAVWCAPDRAKAWDALMSSRATLPAAPQSCSTPLEENQSLAQRFNVRGTPAVYLANGRQVGGYLPRAELEKALGELR